MVVYVPAPPPAAAPVSTTAAAETQVLVIEEPAPPPEPEPAEISPPPEPEPTVPQKPRSPARPETPAETDATSNPGTPPAEVPALEPRESSAQETELRRRFAKLEQDVQERIARLSGAQLSPNNRKTLEDARTFSAQAAHANASGDLPRALNLVRKASLLLAALE